MIRRVCLFENCNFFIYYCVMRITFEFSDLEAFLAVADLGSFQRAAEQLNLSQPALTRRIQKLEASLGAKLFDRTTRSLSLTLAAKRLRSRAQAMVDDAAEAIMALQDETARFEYERNAIVTVALVPSATQQILTGAIKEFRRRGHSARIRILDQSANDVAEAVAQGEADFGISSIPALEPNISFQPIADDRFVLAFRRDHPLAEQAEVHWKSLKGLPLIVAMKGTGNRMVVDEALARARQDLSWSYEVRRSTTALCLAEAGIGVAVLPETATRGDPESLIVSRPLIAPSVSRTIGTVRRVAQRLPKSAEALIDILAEGASLSSSQAP